MEKHANLGFSCVWTFYSEILASWTMSLSIIIYFFLSAGSVPNFRYET